MVMKRRVKQIVWGLVLVAVGVVIGLNAMNLLPVDLFFKGWWTLFLIVPGVIGLFTERDKTGNFILASIGVFLLLGSQDRIGYDAVWKLMLVAIVISVGMRMIFGGIFKKKRKNKSADLKSQDGVNRTFVFFAGERVDFAGREFEGADLTAIFGSVKCDLRKAIFTKDTVINVNAVFGGISILFPQNVSVQVNTSSVFGAVDNNTQKSSEMFPITVRIEGSTTFGGVSLK